MCGIVGYIGANGNVTNVLLNGLRRLEYRGYDSAGIAVLNPEGIHIQRAMGKVDDLRNLCQDNGALGEGHAGIAHTRWATHGVPSEENAHPHFDNEKRFACVHNGIIENHRFLRDKLEKSGHSFSSETDSEVIPHLIAEFYQGDLLSAVATALQQVEGTFGIVVICKDHPDQLVVARRGSPIVIGVGENETIVASDVSAIVGHTSKVIFLEDHDIALVTQNNVEVRSLDNVPLSREVKTVDWDVGSTEKDGFDHFMLKEIHEQPEALENAIHGRLDHREGTAILSGINMSAGDLATYDRIIIAACGTSLHASMMGEYFLEDLANIVTEVEQAAEFRYRNPILDANTLVIAVSQSGETADTLAALREAKMKGAQVLGLCNVVGSTIAREAERGVYLHAGPEIGVASTKAFTCQVAVLLMMALKFARGRRMTRQRGTELAEDIEKAPEYVKQVLERTDDIERIAKKWAGVSDCFFIGRGYLYPVALEGALKLKEISYLHAEGYHAAELKHGPLALLGKDVPVVALANDVDGKDKVISNIQECRARKAPVIITATDDDHDVDDLSDDIIRIPRSGQHVTPITTVVALQLFSYFVAKERGCEIDQPRNLAKSVTVE